MVGDICEEEWGGVVEGVGGAAGGARGSEQEFRSAVAAGRKGARGDVVR